MLYFDKKLATGLNGVNHAAQFKQVQGQRRAFNEQQRGMRTITGNAAAVIPRDVYVEFDNVTKALARSNNLTMMQDLMPLARSLPVGKIEYTYRKASDSGIVQTSVMGQIPGQLDKTAYSYDSAIKVVHQTAFGRGWMEMEGQQSEGFSGLIDDQANAVRNLQTSIANHFFDGTTDTFNGTTAVGIATSTDVISVDLDASDLNFNFATNTTPATIRSKFIALIDKLTITNNVQGQITAYISREIESNFLQFFSTSDTGFGTVLDNLKKLPRIADIKVDATLSGNEIVMMVLDTQYIQPLVGMAIATVPLFRANPMDNYNFLTYANVGLAIKSDYNSQKGVLYAREIS